MSAEDYRQIAADSQLVRYRSAAQVALLNAAEEIDVLSKMAEHWKELAVSRGRDIIRSATLCEHPVAEVTKWQNAAIDAQEECERLCEMNERLIRTLRLAAPWNDPHYYGNPGSNP
jgi:hypothetical protein